MARAAGIRVEEDSSRQTRMGTRKALAIPQRVVVGVDNDGALERRNNTNAQGTKQEERTKNYGQQPNGPNRMRDVVTTVER